MNFVIWRKKYRYLIMTYIAYTGFFQFRDCIFNCCMVFLQKIWCCNSTFTFFKGCFLQLVTFKVGTRSHKICTNNSTTTPHLCIELNYLRWDISHGDVIFISSLIKWFSYVILLFKKVKLYIIFIISTFAAF